MNNHDRALSVAINTFGRLGESATRHDWVNAIEGALDDQTAQGVKESERYELDVANFRSNLMAQVDGLHSQLAEKDRQLSVYKGTPQADVLKTAYIATIQTQAQIIADQAMRIKELESGATVERVGVGTWEVKVARNDFKHPITELENALSALFMTLHEYDHCENLYTKVARAVTCADGRQDTIIHLHKRLSEANEENARLTRALSSLNRANAGMPAEDAALAQEARDEGLHNIRGEFLNRHEFDQYSTLAWKVRIALKRLDEWEQKADDRDHM